MYNKTIADISQPETRVLICLTMDVIQEENRGIVLGLISQAFKVSSEIPLENLRGRTTQASLTSLEDVCDVIFMFENRYKTIYITYLFDYAQILGQR